MDDAGGQMIPLFSEEVSLSSVTPAAVVVTTRRSFADPVLCDDDHVLQAMLIAEDLGQLSATAGHFAYSRGDLQPPMRRVIVTWMFEVLVICGRNRLTVIITVAHN